MKILFGKVVAGIAALGIVGGTAAYPETVKDHIKGAFKEGVYATARLVGTGLVAWGRLQGAKERGETGGSPEISPKI